MRNNYESVQNWLFSRVSVWVRGATEAEIIKRRTNTATLTELQSSARHARQTTIAREHSSEICLVQMGGNQNNFAERGKNTHHISSGVLPKGVWERLRIWKKIL